VVLSLEDLRSAVLLFIIHQYSIELRGSVLHIFEVAFADVTLGGMRTDQLENTRSKVETLTVAKHDPSTMALERHVGHTQSLFQK